MRSSYLRAVIMTRRHVAGPVLPPRAPSGVSGFFHFWERIPGGIAVPESPLGKGSIDEHDVFLPRRQGGRSGGRRS